MICLLRGIVVVITVALITNCSSSTLFEANEITRPTLNGHVYLIRGLLGEVFSRGLDQLAESINSRGVPASVHGLLEVNSLTEEIVRKFKSEPSSSPVILIGHSSGGDAVISMAQRLKIANVPVGLAIGFDPTPLAGSVPSNVEVFINLFQKNNPIGGGEVKAETGFPGRLVNVDLREHTEIIHITLDKSSNIHTLVTDEIIGFALISSRKEINAQINSSLKSKKQTRSSTAVPAPTFALPLYMKYIVPRGEPIELWDSGLRVTADVGENLQLIAHRYGAPAWAIAQINNLRDDSAIQSGTALIIPLHQYKADTLPITEAPPH